MADTKAIKLPEAQPMVVESNKENAQPSDSEEDPYAISSDSEDEAGPPPMINIGDRTTDLGSLKTAFTEAVANSVEKQEKTDEIPEELRIGKENLTNLKGNFEGSKNGPETSPKPRQKLTDIDREKYSKFKDRFEHLDEEIAKHDEEKKKQNVLEIEGVGVQTLSVHKDRFEKGIATDEEQEKTVKQPIEIERTAADKRRVQRAFNKKPKEEEPKDCAICGKMVYPVEKLAAEKKVFHNTCFKCSKCNKSLSVTNYNSHEGNLLCKIHMMEIFHPEVVANLNAKELEDLEDQEVDEEEEYALVSKPRKLNPNVVRSGLKPSDDFEKLPQLANVKNTLDSAVQQTKQTEKPQIEKEVFEEGNVKSHLTKLTDENVEQPEKMVKEELKFEVGASTLKSRWETGEVETATKDVEDRSTELDELKKNVSVKERFKERNGDEVPEEGQNRKSVLEQEAIDTSLSVEARQRFKEGKAFQDSSVEKANHEDIHFQELGNVKERFEKGIDDEHLPAEKTEVDVRCAELGNIKAAFEGGEFNKDENENKKEQLDAEFKKFRSERRKQELREQREKEDAMGEEKEETKGDDVRHSVEMSSIKERFEKGEFESEVQQEKISEIVKKRPEDEVEIKVAGIARQRFKEIDANSPKEAILPKQTGETRSKWSPSREHNVPEPINRRATDEPEQDEEEEHEVKNLLNKFQKIGHEESEEKKKPKPKRQITPPPADYRAEVESEMKERDPNVVISGLGAEEDFMPAADTKNLKARFEKVEPGEETAELTDAKRKQLEEEFQIYKAQKEQAKAEEPQDEPLADVAPKEEIAVGPEHAQKMKKKWEKIERKEAKKAQKTAGTPRKAPKIQTPIATYCFVCDTKVYLAEQVECDGKMCHRRCFKCHTCHISLRSENSAIGADGAIYCVNHHKQLFNNLARPLFNGRLSREA